MSDIAKDRLAPNHFFSNDWGMKKYIFLVCGIVVAAGVLGLAMKNKQQGTSSGNRSVQTASATPTPGSPAAQVTLGQNGFSPATVTIKEGGTVAFTNQGSQGMWVASDPHPQHTDYPDFDALRLYKPGETYSFTFTKPGTWHYHNHLDTGETGTVIVE